MYVALNYSYSSLLSYEFLKLWISVRCTIQYSTIHPTQYDAQPFCASFVQAILSTCGSRYSTRSSQAAFHGNTLRSLVYYIHMVISISYYSPFPYSFRSRVGYYSSTHGTIRPTTFALTASRFDTLADYSLTTYFKEPLCNYQRPPDFANWATFAKVCFLRDKKPYNKGRL